MAEQPPHIIVVGAGIVGAAMAFYLSKRTTHITLIERNAVAAAEVTEKSFAWINPSGRIAERFQHLYTASLAEYHKLETELPHLNIDWNGALTWGNSEQTIGGNKQILQRQQVIELEPNLKDSPSEASFAHEEGALDPVLLTESLLAAAEQNGAKILYDTTVTELKCEANHIVGVNTSNGFMKADVVVLATGAVIDELCRPLQIDVPVYPSPSITIRMNSPEKLIHTLISNSSFEARQLTDQILLAAEDYIDESVENGPEAIWMKSALF